MNPTSTYYKSLINAIVQNSVADNWNQAVTEWSIDDVKEDVSQSSPCICGKEKPRYLYTIKNINNGKTVYPISSACIKKFERPELNEEIAVKEQMFRLLHAIKDNSFLALSSKLFSRKLLLYLYDNGAFEPNTHNKFNPYNDYQFMLDMFNKRNRSEKQEKRVTAIILSSVKPFLLNTLEHKTNKKPQGEMRGDKMIKHCTKCGRGLSLTTDDFENSICSSCRYSEFNAKNTLPDYSSAQQTTSAEKETMSVSAGSCNHELEYVGETYNGYIYQCKHCKLLFLGISPAENERCNS